MSNNLLSFAGWYILPNLATGWIQSIYYGIAIRAGDPKPQPGSPKFIRDQRMIHIAVILAYLLYTVYEADWQIRRAGDFYQALGVSPDVDDKALQSRFRRLTVLHHPDKVARSDERPAAEAYFLHLKQARDTLIDPVKRFAYDSLGPEMLECKHCITIRDYLDFGAKSIYPYYVGGGLFMILLYFLGHAQWGPYWRFLAFASLAVLELHTITRSTFPAITERLLNPVFVAVTVHPPYLPFQLLTLARKVVIILFIALNQLGPLIQPRRNAIAQQGADAAQQQQLHHLELLAKATDQEATRLLGLDLAPFAADEQAMNMVKGGLKEWLVQNTIRGDPEVRNAVGRVIERRRAGVPAGARGA
ncbi:hypothetical protein B0A49_02710 [Cryomyces minteri]|uniref:J domain-containing protein n=1 Tax=Cryomyces minteri TaxID=331657 RepID=A0A4U0XI55_9PEZI|nr:hypothetical protein B0A49_02710 [Cryomyces minteri]